ncbi:putative ORFan [Tupanvirus deep ocean]|uniref:ORFan n=2 Tax=Tupanvirus TaxID=2094720 RepID=A0AC62AA67_9VIRU|nr:putative ORFan [Tupanvirus deep ocean]QKU34523.1 putative ORFan [Tupanvirus deep ocean]
MPQFKHETENYVKTFKFGPGLKFSCDKKIKSEDQKLKYRKEKGLDVYNDSDVLIGKYYKRGNTWKCFIKINNIFGNDINLLSGINKMLALNELTIKNKLDIPIFCSVHAIDKDIYFMWTYNKKGYFLKQNVQNEIMRVVYLLEKVVTMINNNNNHMDHHTNYKDQKDYI